MRWNNYRHNPQQASPQPQAIPQVRARAAHPPEYRLHGRPSKTYLTASAGLAVILATAPAGAATAPAGATVLNRALYSSVNTNWTQLFKELHSQRITITVADWGTGGNGTTAAEMNAEKAAFEKQYPNITINTSTLSWWVTGNVGQAWYAALAAGNIPDVGQVPFTEPTHMIDSGYSANIAPELKALGWTKYLNPTILKLVSRGGKIYGLPESDYVMGLQVNPLIFKTVGLWNKQQNIPAYPATWPQFIADAKLIHEKDPSVQPVNFDAADTGSGWSEMNITRAYGCVPETYENGKWVDTSDGPGCIKGFNIIKELRYPVELIESNYASVQSAEPAEWAANKIAMTISYGIDNLDSAEITDRMSPSSFAMGPMPSAPGGKPVPVLGGVYGTFSPKDTPLQLLAGIKWVEYSQGLDPLGGPTFLKAAKRVIAEARKIDPTVSLGVGSSADVTTSPYASDAPAIAELRHLEKPYINVDPKEYAAYFASFKYGTPEPPVDTQQWYQQMANVTEKIFATPTSNVAAILRQAANQFQKEYLDR